MGRTRLVIATIALLAVGSVHAAGADPEGSIVASPPGASLPQASSAAYLPTPVETTAGTSLTFLNLDPTGLHNVWHSAAEPRFTSSLVGLGQTRVIGVSSLPPGSYPFHCTLHGFMRGTLVVT